MKDDKLKEMGRLGIEATKAGDAMRKLTLAFGRLKHLSPKYKSWEQPYNYHN
tara:strand:+ start:3573 stop:3728 length:156 start_codon:yes stop_codon:yes gene_type:complete